LHVFRAMSNAHQRPGWALILLAALASCSDPATGNTNDGANPADPGDSPPDSSDNNDPSTPDDDGQPPPPNDDGPEAPDAPDDPDGPDTPPPNDDDGQVGKGNPDAVGTGARKTIALDGINTDNEWGADTLLLRDPAADDARFLGSNWTAHEAPWDYAALHAAWDDEFLYVGLQYVNVTDVLDPANLGSSEGSQIHGMDLIQFVAFDVTADEGYTTGGDMWGKDHEFIGADAPDFQLYFHSNFSQEGTYWGAWDGVTLVHVTDGLETPALAGAGGEFFVGSTLPGVAPQSDDSTPGTYPTTTDYIADGHQTAYDTFFEIAVPLSLLGVTSARLDDGTIGLFAANGDGSAVDSIPNDPATSSTPGVSPSNSPLEWDFGEDDDQYSVPFALVGTPADEDTTPR